jgi:hypothetical protein
LALTLVGDLGLLDFDILVAILALVILVLDFFMSFPQTSEIQPLEEEKLRAKPHSLSVKRTSYRASVI